MLKKWLNISWVQEMVAGLIVAYIRFCYATTRFSFEGLEEARLVWAKKGPAVMVFWHESLMYGHKAWPKGQAPDLCVLASSSREGRVSALINQGFGHVNIFGSKAKKSDLAKDKGGASAFRGLLRWLKAGNGVAMTPDGPRGPRRVMSEGTLKLALMANAPIILVAGASKGCKRLKSWDRMLVPVPFTTGFIHYQVIAPDDARFSDAAAIKSCLDELTDKAQSLCDA